MYLGAGLQAFRLAVMAQGLNTMNLLKTRLEPYGVMSTFDDPMHFEVEHYTGATVGVQCKENGSFKLVFALDDVDPLRAAAPGPGLTRRPEVTFLRHPARSGEMYTEQVRIMAGRFHLAVWDAGNDATEEVMSKAESFVRAVFLAAI